MRRQCCAARAVSNSLEVPAVTQLRLRNSCVDPTSCNRRWRKGADSGRKAPSEVDSHSNSGSGRSERGSPCSRAGSIRLERTTSLLSKTLATKVGFGVDFDSLPALEGLLSPKQL